MLLLQLDFANLSFAPLRLKVLLFNFHFLAFSAILAIWSSVFLCGLRGKKLIPS
jgi:hypothetical protein